MVGNAAKVNDEAGTMDPYHMLIQFFVLDDMYLDRYKLYHIIHIRKKSGVDQYLMKFFSLRC